MTSNSLTKFISSISNLLLYKPPSTAKRFVLQEKKSEQPDVSSGDSTNLSESADELNTLLRFAHRQEDMIEQAKSIISQAPSPDQLSSLQQQMKELEKQMTELSPILLSYNSGADLEQRSISSSLKENILMIKKIFRLPYNKDVIMREFVISAKPPRQAMVLFIRGLVDNTAITASVLAPLFGVKEENPLNDDSLELLVTKYLPSNQAIRVADFRAVVKEINSGYTALFVDGASGAVLIETKGFERRAVGRPAIEETVRGSQAAFTETLLTNISLVRLALRSPDLVTEIITLGKRSQTDCAVIYLESVANPDLVTEVKRRVSSIVTDSITPGTLDQFIEDHPAIPFPQIISTERPDRVSSHLTEGRIAILIDGDPFALVVPVSLFTLFQTPDDFALKAPLGTFMRILRFAAAFFTIVIPAIYMAISYYHQEAVPTDLILAIAGARERVPFPSIMEVLFMEISFEIVREAGIRVPGLLGETVGIVGGIILGQAVVAANLVSPITVVIVAITAIASFAIPDFRMGMTVRLIRFLFILAGLLLGLIGIGSLLFLLTGVLCWMKSFGVPYLTPLAPKTMPGVDVVFRGSVFRQEERPDELNTLDERRQPSVSRKWVKQKSKEGDTTDEL